MVRHVTIATLNVGYDTNRDLALGYRHASGIRFGGSLENNLSLLEAKIIEAGRVHHAHYVCFSEIILSLGLSGEEAKRAVVRTDGPEIGRLAAAARTAGSYVVVGYLERVEPVGYNSAALLGPQGEIVGVYRKVHITPNEYMNDVYPRTHGDEWPVFETRYAKVGMQICYDYYFPESTRCLALGGAEIIFLPTWHDARGVEQMLALQKARAIDNAVYYVNSCTFAGGHEPHTSARSMVIDPVGVVRADSGFRDGWAVATVDLDDPFPQPHSGLRVPQNMRQMIMNCRRPGTYGAIVAAKEALPWDKVVLDGSEAPYPVSP